MAYASKETIGTRFTFWVHCFSNNWNMFLLDWKLDYNERLSTDTPFSPMKIPKAAGIHNRGSWFHHEIGNGDMSVRLSEAQWSLLRGVTPLCLHPWMFIGHQTVLGPACGPRNTGTPKIQSPSSEISGVHGRRWWTNLARGPAASHIVRDAAHWTPSRVPEGVLETFLLRSLASYSLKRFFP